MDCGIYGKNVAEEPEGKEIASIGIAIITAKDVCS
jgi:hypothetical protein